MKWIKCRENFLLKTTTTGSWSISRNSTCSMQISEYTSGCPKQISELSNSVNNRVLFFSTFIYLNIVCCLWLCFIVCLSTDLRVSPSKAILTHPTNRSRISLRYIFIIASSLWYFYFRYLFYSVNLFNLSCYQLNQNEKKLETKKRTQKTATKWKKRIWNETFKPKTHSWKILWVI